MLRGLCRAGDRVSSVQIHKFRVDRDMRFILLFLVMLTVSVSAETVFISVMPDVPLMPGAQEVEPLSYDKAEGRIAEVSLYMEDLNGALRIQEFYMDTLPQLGWVAGEGQFTRDNEVLQFVIDGDLVRLTIAPQ